MKPEGQDELALGWLSLPLAGHCSKTFGPNPHERASPHIHTEEMTLLFTTGKGEVTVKAWV